MNDTIAALLRSAAWTITGNLGTKPQVKFLASGSVVCNFNIAVNRVNGKKEGLAPDWFGVEIWGDDAQKAADLLSKGQRCTVVGRVRSESYVDKEGVEKIATIIRADSWSTPDAPAQAPAAQSPVWEVKDDSEVPF